MLKAGDKAPELAGLDQNGRKISLAGKKVVLYFYPKDDTPGCTVEACNFRDSSDEIRKRGWEVVGVSTDPVLSHKKFEQKYRLNFPLLADPEKELTSEFGVLAPLGYAQRATFLVGANGLVLHVWPKVSPKSHAAEVIAKIEELDRTGT
ncbi:MAG: peroxiredoxin [Halobacteria archaeon]